MNDFKRMTEKEIWEYVTEGKSEEDALLSVTSLNVSFGLDKQLSAILKAVYALTRLYIALAKRRK